VFLTCEVVQSSFAKIKQGMDWAASKILSNTVFPLLLLLFQNSTKEMKLWLTLFCYNLKPLPFLNFVCSRKLKQQSPKQTQNQDWLKWLIACLGFKHQYCPPLQK
jgi:hypothetical protein